MIYLKIMWLPEYDNFLWRMKSNTYMLGDSHIYLILENFGINLKDWGKEFNVLYNLWLDGEDEDSLYDIEHKIHRDIINKLTLFNNKVECGYKLFYWFDFNRDLFLDSNWEVCPISNIKLVNLGNDYHPNNRLISPNYPIVLPEGV